MKSSVGNPSEIRLNVAPFAGAWIEIAIPLCRVFAIFVAPFAGAWIEIEIGEKAKKAMSVAPFAGAWIEIAIPCAMYS